MKPKIVMLIVTALFLNGCQAVHKNNQSVRGVPVVIKDGGEFPSYLSGIWRQDGTLPREFVITADGHLTSAVVGMGLVRVTPDEEARIPLIEGGEGFFVPGPWTAYYDPATRNLSIGIEILSFQMAAGGQAVEGVIREVFEGPISVDDKKWEVHYFSLPEYHAFTRDGEHHLLKDGSEPEEQEMVFTRVYSPYEEGQL